MRKKPCEWCEEERWWSTCGARGHQLAIEVYPANGIIYITSFSEAENGETDELIEEVDMNYCPGCGRKLC